MQLFGSLEVFYNQRRRHSTIGYVSPAVFERTTAASRREAIAVDGHRFGGIAQAVPTDDRRSWSLL
jgi:hypothetical protein